MLKVAMVKETLAVLRRGAEERPEPDELRRLRLHHAQRPAGEALRHPRRDGPGVPQGDAAAGQPPRRRADDGQRAEGDGQRHHDLAGPARGVGAGPHPGHAAAEAARWTSRPSSRTSAARRRSASNWPSTGSDAECASCHAKIDPPGFALESFDVIGGWRDHYRSVGKGEPVVVNGRTMRYQKGPAVDAGRRAAGRAEVREHRRVQATAAEGQGPARPRPGREAADLRHGRRAREGRPAGDRGDRRQGSRARTTASGRSCTRSCRARCFRHK